MRYGAKVLFEEVSATFINGRRYDGAKDLDSLASAISAELEAASV